MSHSSRLFATATFVTSLVIAAPAVAQQSSAFRIDLGTGVGTTRGGVLDWRTGMFQELLGAARIRPTQSGAIVGAIGIGSVFGGAGDRCLLTPDGGCAEQANFVTAAALVGVDRRLGGGSVRLLTGPAYYRGAGARSLGFRGRLDVASPTFKRVSFALTSTGTLLPNHDDARLFVGGFGLGLAIR